MSDEQQGLVLILHSQISPGFGAGGCLGWDSLGNWDEVMPALGWVLVFFWDAAKLGWLPWFLGRDGNAAGSCRNGKFDLLPK